MSEKIKQSDLTLINDLNAALQVEKHRGIFSVIILFFIFLVTFVIWAYFSPLEEVTRGQGSVIPSSREQIVQSLDPGIIQEMKVKEGEIVEKGQVLLTLDDTRSSAILRESEAKVQNLRAVVARLQAESAGKPLVFADDIPEDVVSRETAAYNARRKAMLDAVEGLAQSKALLDKEIAITQPMVKKGVVSQVELLRMQRQSSDFAQQITERRNRYSADANNELVQTESELAQARENMAMRADPVERSQIKAPLRGVVKNIRINTVGGVVQAGQDILEIVPLDDTLLVQAYISPKDVAFIRPGQPALVKISAYDYSIYGGLEGKVTLISPDTLQDERRRSELNLNADQAYYRILIETQGTSITDSKGQKLDITPGMTATVDIKTGEKTVFQYLIKPITRMKQALQER
ncbi:HlyD family type I secretion periplasmic adaptor subunit [Rodentibacter pneumotropicus]|uniref:Membrane fusion protein (MFP) family protein n=4 Tax=Rodentibacter pneumotropicus TaxID=758 RepID=A0A1V3K3P0_9PAST|nr:HlyD family type I secretion periplasmic adaptor subunit [Rodentibacter pneumotropicus]MCQ9122083.1 HlyD family type I secretion periplasmic adaptor subunit [Rodentibacter pneumotropicus]MDC2826236.1 HlyD family type I secretion periplasmic adaptor subunit [Rodentibacter pneumotropicus]NBH75886.1 HlyD family type I secretion periplasmic adaptor subunit [Rodentibacter pneumotropicus]OOF63959.1 hemolysin secretion protein D [Rodentibacter pneumotropicus]OOF67416.1 hemolysin secretion protein 